MLKVVCFSVVQSHNVVIVTNFQYKHACTLVCILLALAIDSMNILWHGPLRAGCQELLFDLLYLRQHPSVNWNGVCLDLAEATASLIFASCLDKHLFFSSFASSALGEATSWQTLHEGYDEESL